jgi:hypothetical protein
MPLTIVSEAATGCEWIACLKAVGKVTCGDHASNTAAQVYAAHTVVIVKEKSAAKRESLMMRDEK